MSGEGLDATSKVDGRELGSGRGMGAVVRRAVPAARRVILVGALAIVLLLGVVSVAGATNTASFNWYWYNGGNENCWQTGQLGSESKGCDNIGAGFLEVPGRLVSAPDGIGENVQRNPSGDYCTYYGPGSALNKQDSKNESGTTGFGTPTPYGSYNEWNEKGDVCQANNDGFGQELTEASCTVKTCGMGHYVSLHEQGYNDQPWSTSFGSPSLIVSAEAIVQTLTGSSPGAWGYLCPVFEETGLNHSILEYCLQEWRGSGNAKPEWEDERIGTCAHGPANNSLDTVQTFFYTGTPGTQFATNEGAQTAVDPSGWRTYAAKITEANLKNAIELDRKPYKEKAGNGSGEATPELGYGCGRAGELSTNPAEYALIGVEQGTEGWNFTKIGAGASNLQLHTEYTPLPPEATTNGASEIKPLQAQLNGSVNPRGTSTEYFFKYGKASEGYPDTTSKSGAGSGQGSQGESASVATLEPGTKYHYRIVAESAGGTVEGGVEEFKTPGPVEAVTSGSGASGILAEQATLNGTVNPRGYDAKFYFEYGETTTYKYRTAEADAGSGESAAPVTATVTGLKPAAAFHYRVVATSGGVTSKGADQIFKTSGQRGVSCVSSSFCMSVGTYNVGLYSYTLGEVGNSAGWSIIQTGLPPEAVHSELDGVSCVSTSFCMAVGTYSTGQYSYTFGEEWNGKEWANIPTFVPSGALHSELDGVSCTSTKFCMAVGAYSTGPDSYTLGEEWNGTKWANIPVVYPETAVHSELDGVSCTSTTFCMAVGSYSVSAGWSYVLGNVWNGTKWASSAMYFPRETAIHSKLDGVSCTSTTFCMAVGTYSISAGYSYTLGNEWTGGSEWLAVTTTNPTGSEHSELDGVSCTATTFCMATGTYTVGQYSYTLGEKGTSAGWTNSPVYFPRESAIHSELDGTSCTSTTFCMAMGSYAISAGYSYTLGNEWTGGSEWLDVNSPYPTGSEHSEL
jgi:hypothetical protein